MVTVTGEGRWKRECCHEEEADGILGKRPCVRDYCNDRDRSRSNRMSVDLGGVAVYDSGDRVRLVSVQLPLLC